MVLWNFWCFVECEWCGDKKGKLGRFMKLRIVFGGFINDLFDVNFVKIV